MKELYAYVIELEIDIGYHIQGMYLNLPSAIVAKKYLELENKLGTYSISKVLLQRSFDSTKAGYFCGQEFNLEGVCE